MKITSETRYSLWLQEWLTVYKKPYLKPHSIVEIEMCIRKYMPADVLDTPLCEITPHDINRALLIVPTSRMRVYTFDVYNASLEIAYKYGYITRNPVSLCIKPKHKRNIGQAFNQKELRQFLLDIQHTPLRRLFMFYLYTGCRRSEALSVKWSDVDFEKRIIHIRGTKTEKSDRNVPIVPELLNELKTAPRSQDGLLFHYSTTYISRTFHKICPTHKLHDLRHTFATRCLECGINLKVVQKWLGHTRLDTTANIYVHTLDTFLAAEALKFRLCSA